MARLRANTDDAAPNPGRMPAFRVAAVLGAVILGQAALIAWLWPQRAADSGDRPGRPTSADHISETYEGVDFSSAYPGLSDEEIRQVQRVGFAQRFLYEPYVQFRVEPGEAPFVEVTEAGYRAGPREQPWPPPREQTTVFVYGGSTAFGYGVAPQDTIAHALQEILQAKRGAEARVQVYNFGCGYFFSVQELALFESHLRRGIVPDVAVFIDGLNEFSFADGLPHYTRRISRFFAPDRGVPAWPEPEAEAEMAHWTRQVIDRYRRTTRMVEMVASGHGVVSILVGQPLPFLHLPAHEQAYPFAGSTEGLELVSWAWPRFEKQALAGAFGARFVWCGDAFSEADEMIYVDRVHYSGAGARLLAAAIVARAEQRGLLWGIETHQPSGTP